MGGASSIPGSVMYGKMVGKNKLAKAGISAGLIAYGTAGGALASRLGAKKNTEERLKKRRMKQ